MARFCLSMLLGSAFLASALVAPALASAAVPMPATTPAANATCEMPAEIGPVEAFAQVVDDPRSLAFFSYVVNVEGKNRDRVMGRLRTGLPVEATDDIAKALTAQCVVPEIAYRSTRLIYALATRWNGEDAIAIQREIRFAFASLVLGDAISAKTRDATLAFFDTSAADLDARLTATSARPPADPADATQTTLCRTIEAKATKAIVPDYPASAQAVNAGGDVDVVVSLDPHGFVRSIAFLASTTPDRPASQDLVTAAIIAAGASNYTPKFVECEPVRSTYEFRATFDTKPEK